MFAHLAWSVVLLFVACSPVSPPLRPLSTSSALPTLAPVLPSPLHPTPSPEPQASEVPQASASPSATPTPEPTPLPSATPQVSPTPVPAASLRVRVFDEGGNLRSSAIVRITSLDPELVLDERLSEEAGFFQRSGLPAYRSLRITASEGGMTTRSQIVSLAPGEDRLLEFKDTWALSNQPEVIAIEPGYSRVWDPYATIRITFSEPMDKTSVEDSIAIQAASAGSYFLAGNMPVPYSPSLISNPETVVFDVGQFIPRWQNGDQILELQPRIALPATTGSDFRLVFNHQPSPGQGGGIRDRSGVAARVPQPRQTAFDAEGRPVTVQDGPVYIQGEHEPYIPFSVGTGFKATLGVASVSANASNPGGDSLRVYFKEPLFLTLPSGLNLPPDEVAGALNPASYQLSCNGVPVVMPPSAHVQYLSDTAIELKVIPSESLFSAEDSCRVTVSGIVTPTGERISATTHSFRPL